ncbi:hypothetical protein FIV42_05675 [Persicimonas caeni]|uniref:Uncharacterized protein n=1 Tax=Persicimonas caeni TaxID=2292766 RepID=A0A4Y6PPG9_PERCE|nr:hypothetical protein [Persicimonas caeni]QDG50236.1 hypothetical protein FIV42_05675 [Persicimonas caeni]QED31457.1 hypothetical protein FRD00_05670 [Persicimonas caeni]
MTAGTPRSPESALPDLSVDVVTRLVAGRCYFTDLSSGNFRAVLAFAQRRGLTVVPAGCEADLSYEDDDMLIQGPFVIGRQVVWTTADAGPSQPFGLDDVQQAQELSSAGLDAEFEQVFTEHSGPSSAIEEGIFLCNTGPMATGTLVFGTAGTREEAELTGGEYVWGHDMEKLPHDEGVIGEVIASVEYDEVEKVDFSADADQIRREQAVPYADEPVYFLVSQYD